MIAELVICALATWWLTYQVCFGLPLEGLRARLGIGYDYDANGRAIDRWADNWLAVWLNCYSCVAIVAGLVLIALCYVDMWPIIRFLALLGLANLLGRWWMSQRPKREWWL